jgi:hypothetical protein
MTADADKMSLLDQAAGAEPAAEEPVLPQSPPVEEAGSPGDESILEQRVKAVAQRLAGKAGSLRRLGESRHQRSETEEALRKLTAQNWQVYLNSAGKENLGFRFIDQQVVPLNNPEDMPGKHFPLEVKGEVIGTLAVDAASVEQEDVGHLIGVISERLGSHLEGLRLAE